jgi:multiple sugar transport system substrate-binding protein
MVMRHLNWWNRIFGIGLAILCLAGCGGPRPEAYPPALPLAGQKLCLVVADDPPMAAAIRQLCDQWNAETGAELDVRETTERELAAAEKLPGDAAVCPACLHGLLADRGLVAAIPAEFHRDDAGPWADIFDLLRLREARWAGQTTAVPLGSPLLCCYYRADLLEKLHRRPPQTWAEYLDLAKALGEPAGPPDRRRYGAIEPLAAGWAGLVLLARAAPYLKHPDNYATLFDIETMEPLVTGPPMVRALTELVAAAKLSPPEMLGYDPAAVRRAFWEGRCGLALSWPTAARLSPPLRAKAGVRVGFATLPGTAEVYNVTNKAWETREEGAQRQVPLLGIAGRVGLAAKGQQQEAASRLLLWLASQQWSPRVSAASSATTLFRRSHLGTPGDWVERPVGAAAAAEYAAATELALHSQQSVVALYLPGRAEYLQALDEAVQAAVRGQRSPADALAKAADKWREITKRLGHDRQKTAYLHSLGLN